MTYKKYSKSSAFYLTAKADFFASNDALLQKAREQNKIYASQPKREKCKLCGTPLPNEVDFTSHGIDYVFCTKCTHLNGVYDDTRSFVEKLYLSDSGKDYAQNYLDENFLKRTADIYTPKIDFLQETLPDTDFKLLDLGCGSGYLVLAALMKGIPARGIDMSETMIEFGNTQIQHHHGSSPLKAVCEDGFLDELKNCDADVISAIGVIEHLRDPQKFFAAFKESKANYLYYSVPMFSFSAVLENVFPNVFPRQLSGGHTHIFTNESLNYMNEVMQLSSVGEWWFGTDVMDLYRHVMVNLQANGASQKMIDLVYESFGSQIDTLQATLDRNHATSEIHLVAAKKP